MKSAGDRRDAHGGDGVSALAVSRAFFDTSYHRGFAAVSSAASSSLWTAFRIRFVLPRRRRPRRLS